MITSPANSKIKLVRALQAKRGRREAEQAFVVEGVRLIEEAARAGAAARLVLHTTDLDARSQAALASLARLGGEVEAVSPEVMAHASEAQAPQGVLAVLPWPALAPPNPLDFALVLDSLRDPGNLGTVLRAGEAAGVQAVFLAPGSVDIYNPKVVRAAVGAHFHLPIVAAGWDALERALADLALWRAEAHAGQPYDQVDWRRPSALILGSEAAGPSDAARRLAPNCVHIPMAGQAESLNAAVAAAVLMFEVARQRREKK